jgi:hypothetical protein
VFSGEWRLAPRRRRNRGPGGSWPTAAVRPNFVSLVAPDRGVERQSGQPAAAMRAAHPPSHGLPAALAVRSVLTNAHLTFSLVIDCPNGPHTHSVSEVCEMIGCDSEDWLIDRVRDGRFPARKIVRQLRFTDADIEAILAACANVPRGRDPDPLLPTRTRRKRQTTS